MRHTCGPAAHAKNQKKKKKKKRRREEEMKKKDQENSWRLRMWTFSKTFLVLSGDGGGLQRPCRVACGFMSAALFVHGVCGRLRPWCSVAAAGWMRDRA